MMTLNLLKPNNITHLKTQERPSWHMNIRMKTNKTSEHSTRLYPKLVHFIFTVEWNRFNRYMGCSEHLHATWWLSGTHIRWIWLFAFFDTFDWRSVKGTRLVRDEAVATFSFRSNGFDGPLRQGHKDIIWVYSSRVDAVTERIYRHGQSDSKLVH